MSSSQASRLWLALAPAAVVSLLTLTPRVRESPALAVSFWGASGFLLVWAAYLWLRRRAAGSGAPDTRGREGGPGSDHVGEVDVVLRPQHYLQAVCQIAVLAYWGFYWRPVYDMAVPIVAQIAFAYGFSMLLAWSRGRRYTLGFGPFPIILSIALFLWFKDHWFYLQFLMIGVGFLGKELIRWQRNGRRVHVFNPSAFALGLFSLALIATGTTDLTWGREIASTLTLAPHIYLALFLVGLVVMYFFSITLVAGSAAAVLFGLSAAYFARTGVPYFVDSEIPAAVFLGLHLLITDPSTSPRSPSGKAIFGALYGVGVFALYSILTAAGAPTFYDKLLCVPLLNLGVRAIDHVAGVAAAAVRARPPKWSPARLNLAFMGVWVVFFSSMALTGRTDGGHIGDRVPFWQSACAEGRRHACDRLVEIETTYCGDNAAWACNELGLQYSDGRIVEADAAVGTAFLERACELRFQASCINLLDPTAELRPEPRSLDLRLLLREGGLNLMQMPEPELYARACEHGWTFACARAARPS